MYTARWGERKRKRDLVRYTLFYDRSPGKGVNRSPAHHLFNLVTLQMKRPTN
jgi:hypothetical protein